MIWSMITGLPLTTTEIRLPTSVMSILCQNIWDLTERFRSGPALTPDLHAQP